MATIVIRARLEDETAAGLRSFQRGLDRARRGIRETGRDLEGMRRRLRRVGDGFRRFGRAAGRALRMLARGAAAAGVALLGVATGVGFMTNRIAESTKNIQRWNQITGLSVTALDALDRAARRYGLEVDTITEAQIAAVDRAQAALLIGGDGVLDFFREFGIDAASFVELDPAMQLQEMARAATAAENPVLRAAIASALFGDEAVKLLPVLTNLANVGLDSFITGMQESGDLLDEQSTRTLVRAGSAWDLLRERLAATASAVAVRLAPTLTAIYDWLRTRFIPLIERTFNPILDDTIDRLEQFFGLNDRALPDIRLQVSYAVTNEETEFEAVVRQVQAGIVTAFNAARGDPEATAQVRRWIQSVIFRAAEEAGNLASRADFWLGLAAATARGFSEGLGLFSRNENEEERSAIGSALSTLLGAGILFAILNPIQTAGMFAMFALVIARRLSVALVGTEVVAVAAAGIRNFLIASFLAAAGVGAALALGVAIGVFIAWVVGRIANALGLETQPVTDAIITLIGIIASGRLISYVTDVVVPFYRSIGISLINAIISGINSAIGGLYSLVASIINGLNSIAGSVGLDLGLRAPQFTPISPISGGFNQAEHTRRFRRFQGYGSEPFGARLSVPPTTPETFGTGRLPAGAGIRGLVGAQQAPVQVRIEGELAGLFRVINEGNYNGALP